MPKIEQRTLKFIAIAEQLKKQGKLPGYGELGAIMGIKSKSTISEIMAKRQNIQPASWERFKTHFKVTEHTDFPEQDAVFNYGNTLGQVVQKPEKDGVDGDLYREKYIQELQEKSQILKDQVQFLQRVVESSLIEISSVQKDLQAQVMGSVRRSAERFANEDPKKTKAELDKISKYAAQVRFPGAAKGIPAREGT